MDGPNKVKGKRKYSPKVKTGCLTCKVRRVKCDEERPYCKRCIKFGMPCDGYAQDPNPPNDDTQAQKSLSKSAALRPLRPRMNELSRYCPSISLQVNGQEMRYFQDFVQDSSLDNSGRCFVTRHRNLYSDSFFWNGIVLQESHSNACTRHALIAIGALARSLQQNRERELQFGYAAGTGLSSDQHREFALSQYHMAVQNLRKAIVSAENNNETRTSLVACLVLASFDTFYGHGEFATKHIEYARQVVNDWRRRNKSPGIQVDFTPDSIDNITRLFTRLDTQVTTFLGAGQNISYSTLDSTNFPRPIPREFANLQEAKYFGHLLVTRGFNFYLQAHHLRHTAPDLIPPETLARREYFIEQFYLFDKASRLVLPNTQGPQSRDKHPLTRPGALKLYPVAVIFRLLPGWGTPEIACDTLLEHFEFVVSLARDIVEYEAETNAGIDVFCFEYRILPMLFLAGTKCRDRILRREAIRIMLSSHWREGIWDSLLCGKTVQWIMEMEEEGIDENGFIPEHARCFGETFHLDMPKRTAVVKCKQNVRYPRGGSVERTATITW